MDKHLRPCMAELIGTFLVTLLTAGTLCSVHSLTANTLPILALVHVFAYSALILATQHISGGHLNPAITIGQWVFKKIEWDRTLYYLLSQLLGGLLAGAFLAVVFGSGVQEHKLGTPYLQGQSFGNLALFPNGALVETLMGFAYALVFLLTVVDRRAPKWSAAAVGLAAGAAVLLGGSVTLAGLNPARTLGTGVFAEAMGAGLIRHQLVYWLGSVIGAVLAGALYYHYLDESAAPQRPLQK